MEDKPLLTREQLKEVFTKFLNSKKSPVESGHRTLWQTFFYRVGQARNDLNKIFLEEDPDHWLDAFDWEKSPEGYSFWDRTDDEWLAILQDN